MEVFRLSKTKYKSTLSGKGASRYGARWNSQGTELIYTASSRALAMAEVVVHISAETLANDYYMLVIYVPDTTPIRSASPEELPNGWNRFPYTPGTQFFGDRLISENRYGILKVPSAVVKGDFNFLINPFHHSFKYIKIIDEEPFLFDQRVF
ncbi:RES family NAD+ phosphorylase [Membranihabitans maritimus]|uniref:RES family NAD+ phosphorylase n=1 Tax=Membranihabitans maritimus TaxID=2904244 RepID=UPI001F2CF141|nr:RES family NAD+ phosphorylase [Membranihabitans maritimus]